MIMILFNSVFVLKVKPISYMVILRWFIRSSRILKCSTAKGYTCFCKTQVFTNHLRFGWTNLQRLNSTIKSKLIRFKMIIKNHCSNMINCTLHLLQALCTLRISDWDTLVPSLNFKVSQGYTWTGLIFQDHCTCTESFSHENYMTKSFDHFHYKGKHIIVHIIMLS